MTRTMHCSPPRALVIAVLAVLWATAVARAQDPPGAVAPPTPVAEEHASARDDGCRTIVRLPANLFRAALGIFSNTNVKAALAGSAATGVAALYDQPIAEALDDPDSTLGAGLATAGRPRWSGALVGVLFVGGRFAGGARFRAASYDWLEAYLVNLGYTEIVKDVVGRTRPNRQDDRSFPSGHASNAFALAAVTERHYGWKVGVPAYGLAALVSASRLKQSAHYLSDVLAGATLGYIVGRTVVRVNDNGQHPGKTQVNVSPALSRHASAVVVQVCWR